MPSTQNITQYTISAGLGNSTPGGTEVNGEIGLFINAGSDFTDADAFALHAAIVEAFPASWKVAATDVSVYRNDQVLTAYATNLTATPPSFT